MRLISALMVIAIAVSGCANDGLRNLKSTSAGPDEFIVQPSDELEIPSDTRSLPAPTPGGTNRTDSNPVNEAVVSLGGRPGDPNAPVPASDGALVTAASRYGVTPNIRQALATEDAEFRRRKARFTQYRLFSEDLYDRVYQEQALDPFATANAWRRAGVSTPSYPPSQ